MSGSTYLQYKILKLINIKTVINFEITEPLSVGLVPVGITHFTICEGHFMQPN